MILEIPILPSLPVTRAKHKTQAALKALNLYARARVHGFIPPRLNWRCHIAERDHTLSMRQFAHTNHHPHMICVAANIGRLHDRFLYGVLAHEMGHLLSFMLWEDFTEDGADEAAAEFLGLEIQYQGPLNLEAISCPEIHRIKSYLPAEEVIRPEHMPRLAANGSRELAKRRNGRSR